MSFRLIGALCSAILLAACASVPKGNPSIGQLDLSAERLVSDRASGIATTMLAEIAYVEDLINGEVLYRYRADERDGISTKVLELAPGKYKVAAFCADRGFTKRFIGFVDMELLQNKYWWGSFAMNSGSTGTVKLQVFDVVVNGGELITPVNMSAEGSKSCSISYGQKKSNSQPSAMADEDAFRAKFSKKATLFN